MLNRMILWFMLRRMQKLLAYIKYVDASELTAKYPMLKQQRELCVQHFLDGYERFDRLMALVEKSR